MILTEEREAKYDLDPDVGLPDLADAGRGVTVRSAGTVRLDAVYYDTVGSDLRARGITLRRRRDRSGAGEELWTLKLPRAEGTATLARRELSWPGAGAEPPEEAVRLLTAVVRGAPLAPVAELRTIRTRRDLLAADGSRLAEVDDDLVEVPWPVPMRFRQVEVELDAGDDELIGWVEGRLVAGGAARGADEPKLDRALGPTAAPRRPAPRRRAARVVAAAVAAGLERLVANDVGVRLGDDPEAVHQARVAVRRLRSDLKTFADLLDPAWADPARRELKWVADALGAVRDADVLAARLAAHAAAADGVDRPAFATVERRAADERAEAVVALTAVLDSPRYLAVLTDLAAAAASPPVADALPRGGDVDRVLRALVRRSWRRLQRTVRRAGAEPADDELHRIRIRAKQLRYAAEAVTPTIGRPARRLARAAAGLQSELGDQHDAVVAEAWLRAAVAGDAAVSALAAGQAVAVERQRAAAGRDAWVAPWEALRRPRLRRWLD